MHYGTLINKFSIQHSCHKNGVKKYLSLHLTWQKSMAILSQSLVPASAVKILLRLFSHFVPAREVEGSWSVVWPHAATWGHVAQFFGSPLVASQHGGLMVAGGSIVNTPHPTPSSRTPHGRRGSRSTMPCDAGLRDTLSSPRNLSHCCKNWI